MADEPARYSIDELADLGNVSRRTVRYYVQEGLLPAPLGVGRGRHYDASHLERLLRVKALQENGHRLDGIRAALSAGLTQPAPGPALSARPQNVSAWRRIELTPGVELHVSADTRLPAQGRLQELAAWCLEHFPRTGNRDTR